MATSQTGNRIRIFGDVVLFGGILLTLLDVLALVLTSDKSESPPVLMLRFTPAGFGLLASITICALLRAVAAVVDRLPPKGQALSDLIGRLEMAISSIRLAVVQLPDELDEHAKAREEETPARSSALALSGAAAPMAEARADGAALGNDQLQRVVVLLEELRDAVLLDEGERRQRRMAMLSARADALASEANGAIVGRHWGRAHQLLGALASVKNDDPRLSHLNKRLADARRASEDHALARLRATVEDQMALGQWDEAFATSSKFAADFPDNAEGQGLLQRVTRERDIYIETTSGNLYDEIKQDIDRRNWRRALTGAQRLLERFPDHRRSEKIRGQLRTIQDNAEIEQRQEQEARIGELIRGKRLHEAIEMAEDLVQIFPDSPQAERLREMLPKLRDRAIQQEAEHAAGHSAG
jgi:tetratricopeptide (TPR) repeat protein